MRHKAHSQPEPHVVFANGLKSPMPDWPTARECAASEEMLEVLEACRTVLFSVQRPGAFLDPYDETRLSEVLGRAIEVINIATGMVEPDESFRQILQNDFPLPPNFPVPPGFPKPPGFK